MVSRDNPALWDLPEKFQEWGEQQKRAVGEIVEAFKAGKRMVVVEGPPGSGKTLVGESVRRMLGVKGIYCCTTKSLQDQFVGDFPYAKVIKGRANYPTELYPERFGDNWNSLTTADCTKRPGENGSCKWCKSVRSCPYEQAKNAALRAELVVANTSYFLSECNGPGRFSGQLLVVFDECDVLATELMRFVTLAISSRKMEKYGIDFPKKITVEESWAEWARETHPKLRAALEGLPAVSGDVRVVRERNWLARTLEQVEFVKRGIEDGGWVYTGRDSIEFKPASVERFGKDYLWKHGERFLCMSGTVISAEVRLADLGWDEDWEFVQLESVFPVKNRRVVIRPVANMIWDKAVRGINPDAMKKVASEIERVEREHPGDRILVHTVSYDLSRYLTREVSTGRVKLTYNQSSERDSVLNTYRRTQGAILFAASFDRGIDLAGDDCRVQVIAKVPYPNLGDKQVSAKVYGTGRRGQAWLNMETVANIIQMTGRAVRSKDDWARTYVLDGQFDALWSKARGMFPKWWRDGLVWES